MRRILSCLLSRLFPLAFLGRNASRGHLFDDRVSPVPDGSEASFSRRSRAEAVTSDLR